MSVTKKILILADKIEVCYQAACKVVGVDNMYGWSPDLANMAWIEEEVRCKPTHLQIECAMNIRDIRARIIARRTLNSGDKDAALCGF